MTIGRRAAHGALALILLVALAWRLNDIGFGLPSMYDPDEPVFMITAIEMLGSGSLNPGWFGHPGSTTIYLLALIDASVLGFGLATGAYGSVAEFTRAAFADPALLFVPARTAMALLGVASVWLTWLVARRLHGPATALAAAGLLAVNGLHIAWSQVVRTDIHASVFMLASLLFAVRAAEGGRLRDYLLAGLFAGFAIATKWPAATVFVAVIGAALYRAAGAPHETVQPLRGAAAAGLALLAGVFVASPYIFLDWQTVIANVAGEMKPGHLAHNGGGFVDNLAWYLWDPVRRSVGVAGLLLMAAGVAVSAARSPVARFTLVPAAFAFLALICSQHVIWSRWVLPLLPMLAIFAAAAIAELARLLSHRLRAPRPALLFAALALLAGVPSILGAFAQAAERANDTREQAARWAVANIPAGSSVVIEHLELSLRRQPWQILFPIGEAGCIDGVKLLDAGVQSREVQRLRNGSPIVDLGNVGDGRLGSCRADYAILTYYDLYKAEAGRYPAEAEKYRKLLAGGRTVALFAPRAGRAGGPVVRIVALAQH